MQGNLRNEALKINDVFKILLDISIALKSMHQCGFVHLDISPGRNY